MAGRQYASQMIFTTPDLTGGVDRVARAWQSSKIDAAAT